MLFLCFLLVKLGFWQLHRASEKKDMLANFKHTRETSSEWSTLTTLPKQYAPIKVKGRFIKPLFYLDNQWSQHHLGYDILLPFVIANSNTVVMVDIGWVPRQESALLPDIRFPKEVRQLAGYVYFPSPKQWVLGQIIEHRGADNILLEKIDTDTIAKVVSKPVTPFIIRLDKKSPFGYCKDWVIVSMPPERHQGYAVQWFALAMVVGVGMIFVFLM